MKRLYAGCRVRIVAGANALNPGMEGSEAIFRHYGPPPGWRLEKTDDCVVEVRGEMLGVNSDQLEPIIPEGHQIVSWSECLWQPEGEVA